jgi:hypothetical protein
VKLVLVGMLIVIHVLTGLVIIRLFGKGEVYPVWRFIIATVLSCLVAGGIIFVVLARPDINLTLPPGVFEPGGLKKIVSEVSPWEIP